MDINYEIYPKVLPVDSEVEVLIRGLDEQSKFLSNQFYEIRVFSKVNLQEENKISVSSDVEGEIKFPVKLNTHGEYLFDVYTEGRDEPVTTGHFFGISSELAKLKPYRGDMHIHTLYSDGRKTPIYMAVTAKKLGLDFIAITDHDRYQPSLEAIEESERLGLSILLMEGEEISVRDRCGHLVAVCTSDWVAEARDDLDNYEKERQEIIENELKDVEMLEGLTKEHYSHAVWAVNKIREYGGYVVIAHPYWVAGRRFHLDRLVYEQLLKDERYDGIEVLGDVVFEDNILSVARYYDAVAEGRKIPIIGNSDTHDSEHTYGQYWTVVFAEELSGESIWKSILELKSVACEHHPGEQFRAFGPFELVEYVFFLNREFFPIHDAICQSEGELYLNLIEDSEVDHEELQHELDILKQKLNNLYDNFFANS